jgi:hypothetical protein
VTRLILVPWLLVACAFAQVPTASLSGVVRANGAPAVAKRVTLFVDDIRTVETISDPLGAYAFTDVAAGRIRIAVTFASGTYQKNVVLSPGQKGVLDVEYMDPGLISGRITDENKKPLKGVTLLLFNAEYALGAVRFTMTSFSTSNEAGEYTVVAPPRVGFYVLARKPGQMPTYYSGAESVDGAMSIITPPGGKREMIDIQMKAAPARCIEGKILTPEGEKSATFEIGENDPPLWAGGSRMSSVSQRTPAGHDGEFRVCSLHPGDYWIKTYSSSDPQRGHGIEYVTIGDKDVSGMVTGPQATFPVDVAASLEGPPPDEPKWALTVGLTSTIGEYGGLSIVVPKVPAHFAMPVSNHGYQLSVRNIPAWAYLKDVTYGGRSILNEVFQPGPAAAADGLRIVLARDGARVSVKTADKDGKPVYDADIAVIPANLTTEAAAATAMIIAKSDANGSWTSGPIAPGKYYVIAKTSAVNRSPDAFGKLWRARSASDVVELAPNGGTQVTRIPTPIE